LNLPLLRLANLADFLHDHMKLVLIKLIHSHDVFFLIIDFPLVFSLRCEVGYTGLRCEHFFLTVHQPLSKEYVALTVILIILILVILAGSMYYFCRW
jgi:hypothetical protein